MVRSNHGLYWHDVSVMFYIGQDKFFVLNLLLLYYIIIIYNIRHYNIYYVNVIYYTVYLLYMYSSTAMLYSLLTIYKPL